MTNGNNIFEENSSNTVVAFTINGVAMTLEEYRKRNKKAVQGYKNGKYKTSQELKDYFKSR